MGPTSPGEDAGSHECGGILDVFAEAAHRRDTDATLEALLVEQRHKQLVVTVGERSVKVDVRVLRATPPTTAS